MENQFHLAVVHFECLLNFKKPPIFNEVVKLTQKTVHLHQLPFRIQQIFQAAVHIRQKPSSRQPFIFSFNNVESFDALDELDQTTWQVIFKALLENSPIIWQSYAFVMCLNCYLGGLNSKTAFDPLKSIQLIFGNAIQVGGVVQPVFQRFR